MCICKGVSDPGRKQLHSVNKLWLWFANAITILVFLFCYSHTVQWSQPQAKKEMCGIFDFFSLLINSNHFSLNLKEQTQVSKRYRNLIQKIIISLGNTHTEMEGSHSHQDSMVLAQRQKYRSMEQNRKPRDKSTYLRTPYLRQRRQEYTMEKRQPL